MMYDFSKGIYFVVFVMCLLTGCTSSCHTCSKQASKTNTELGLGYLEQGNVSRALDKLLTAKSQDPNSPDVFSAIGAYYESVNDPVLAEQHYLKSIRLGKFKGQFHNNYGAFLCRQKRFKQADEQFQFALQDQNYLHADKVYESAGTCAEEAGDFIKAKEYYAQAKVRASKS